MNLLGPVAEQATWALKEFRNFIHPYKVLSGSARLDLALSLSSFAAVKEVSRSLSGRIIGSEGPLIREKAMNFSWVIKDKLAGCRGPATESELSFLRSIGIKALVRLAATSEARVNPEKVKQAGIDDFHEPVADFATPEPAQIDRIMEFIAKSLGERKPVAISCGAGYGRTGTILSCYLVSSGLKAEEAIESVIKAGRRVYELDSQREAIFDFAKRQRAGHS